jgi:hypothetical protein
MRTFFGTLSANLTLGQAEAVYADLRHYLDIAVSLDLISVACRIWAVLVDLRDVHELQAAEDRELGQSIDEQLNWFHEQGMRLSDERSAALRNLEGGFLGSAVPLATAHRRHCSGKVIRPCPLLKPDPAMIGTERMARYRAEKDRIVRLYDAKRTALESARDIAVAPLLRALVSEE